MADQTLAQSGALRKPGRGPRSRNQIVRKIERGWNFASGWAWFRLTEPRRDLPDLVNFVLGDHFFAAMQVRSELHALGEILAELQPRRALEIGTARGGTLLLLTRLANPQATIVSVDLPGGEFGGGYSRTRRWFYQRFARRKQKLHLLQGDSHSQEMLGRVKSAFDGEPLDYLFIDGDHLYEGVKSDLEMYGPLVKKGGLIAFHDIVEGKPEFVGGVPRFWREIRSGYRHKEFIEDPQQGGYGIGVLYVE